VDIGLDCFRRVVFAGRYLLQSCSMDDIIYIFKCSGHALFVSDITDEETKLAGILLEFILHDELLEFITGIDNDLLRIVVVQHYLVKALPKLPVPPVIKMDLSSNNITSSLSKLKILIRHNILCGKTQLLQANAHSNCLMDVIL